MEASSNLLSDLVSIHKVKMQMQMASQKYPMIFSIPLI